ncbi:hypothetical protein KM043_012752 [Ampulex compressa]|nr:hypothetical protein KM043_012752 [Ampulex compressa]
MTTTSRCRAIIARSRSDQRQEPATMMIALSFFIWALVRPKDRQEADYCRRDSRRDSLFKETRDRGDSRRNSKETAAIGLPYVDRRRHRLRRHSRRYYVDRNKR